MKYTISIWAIASFALFGASSGPGDKPPGQEPASCVSLPPEAVLPGYEGGLFNVTGSYDEVYFTSTANGSLAYQHYNPDNKMAFRIWDGASWRDEQLERNDRYKFYTR